MKIKTLYTLIRLENEIIDTLATLTRIVTGSGRPKQIDNSDMKIRTFQNRYKAFQFCKDGDILKPELLRMPCDILANSDGFAWTVSDSQYRYIRECGVLC